MVTTLLGIGKAIVAGVVIAVSVEYISRGVYKLVDKIEVKLKKTEAA